MVFKKLTAKEVASKRFTPVRMREGYSMDEVDVFLEAVETTITTFDSEVIALQKENEDLRNKPAEVTGVSPAELAEVKKRLDKTLGELSDAQGKIAEAHVAKQNAEKRASDHEAEIARLTKELEAAKNAALNAKPAPAAPAEPAIFDPKTMDLTGASATVARMLETAAKNHDDLITEGQTEAERLKKEAESQATELLKNAESEANSKLNEAEEIKRQAYAEVEDQKRGLEQAVQHLQAVEAKAREDLIRLYTSSLEEVQARPSVIDSPADTGSIPQQNPAGRRGNGDSPSFNDVPSFNG